MKANDGDKSFGSLFGQQQPSAAGSLFGTRTVPTSAFNVGFGFGSTSTLTNPAPPRAFGSGFGFFGGQQPQTQVQQQRPQQQEVSGSGGDSNSARQPSPLGAAASTVANTGNGTEPNNIKFVPPTGEDIMQLQGTPQKVNTKQMCVTAMKQYRSPLFANESKSLEELRLEDYAAGRRMQMGGPSALLALGRLPMCRSGSGQPTGILIGGGTPGGNAFAFRTSTNYKTSDGAQQQQNQPGTATTSTSLFNRGGTGTGFWMGIRPAPVFPAVTFKQDQNQKKDAATNTNTTTNTQPVQKDAATTTTANLFGPLLATDNNTQPQPIFGPAEHPQIFGPPKPIFGGSTERNAQSQSLFGPATANTQPLPPGSLFGPAARHFQPPPPQQRHPFGCSSLGEALQMIGGRQQPTQQQQQPPNFGISVTMPQDDCTWFAHSLAASLRGMPAETKELAKVRLQQVVYECCSTSRG